MSRYLLTRQASFTCVHRYFNPDWSEQKNRDVFGLCYSQWGHGHNYQLEITVSGPIASDTGMIVNLATLDDWIQTVTSTVDGKNLNAEVREFENKVPTTENLLLYLKNQIEPLLKNEPHVVLEKIRLYEAPRLWVDWVKESV